MEDITIKTRLITVTCEGCQGLYLGNTGAPSDPVTDVTYRPETQTFVCDGCYHNPPSLRTQVVRMINADFDMEVVPSWV